MPIDDFDMEIKLNPDDAYAYWVRGRAYVDKDELNKAIGRL